MSCRQMLLWAFLLTLVLETNGLTLREKKTYTCRTFGSGVVQPFDGRPFHVRSDCPFTLLTSTHNKVECAITTRRGGNGLLTHAQIVINKIKTDLRQGSIYVSGESIQLPYDHKYQHIFPYGIYTKLRSTVFPLSVFWHTVPGGIDTLWIEIDQLETDMTGLCGNPLSMTPEYNTLDLISQSVLPEETCKIRDPVSISNTACRQFFSYTLDCLRNTTSEYIQLCEENICGFEENQAVGCSFFREIVRLCGKSHFLWDIWRDLTHCGAPECPGELFYAESGPAFVPSCSNQQIDSSELTSSCVCPSGLVLDDHHEGAPCVSVSSCSCVFNHHLYKPGDTRSNRREACLCSDGEWKCTPLHFPPVCVIEGLYVTTLDGKPYVLGEGCSFVAAKGLDWKIVIEYANGEPSIRSAHLELFKEKYSFFDNMVTYGDIKISDLHESEHALVFWQSSMFVEVYSTLGLHVQIQMSPEIQLYIKPLSNGSDIISGLCGNNNGDTTDDFTTNTGIIESSTLQFALSWSLGPCDMKPPAPCIRTEYEIFADEKCSVLTDTTGVFAACHGHISPAPYYTACVQRTCSCRSNLHECLCSALSSYVKACTRLGVEVGDWRMATNCTVECLGNQEFSYHVMACNRTCRSLSGPDLSCLLEHIPVEGCGCPEGTHLNHELSCSSKAYCECHYNGGTTPPGPAVINGRQCICEDGELKCSDDCGCSNGKVCVHCSHYRVDTLQKTCGGKASHSILGQSFCESGCYCPSDQFENHYGDCVPLDNCTCTFSGNVYSAGESVKSDCKTCVCSHGQWLCTDEPCPSKCQVFGNGHYQTFDSKWYRFDGHCQYTLVKDDCGIRPGTFSVRVESVPCCDEALTCSRSIILDFKNHFTLFLSDMNVTGVVGSAWSELSPMYTVKNVGLYIVITVPSRGITLIWDKHTWITVELQPQWKKNVCGLCGNFDSNEMNDLLIKDSFVALSPMAFGNSWKSPSPPCSDLTREIFPCERHSYCAAWAQRRCRIITSNTFKDCHLKVEPEPYYQTCVQESCSCEFEGRFLGFCTAVAAYAEACSDWGVCVDWRTPDVCPVYCDYYNEQDECVWHYEACGELLTCGQEQNFTHKLEGCYPRCPAEKPYYDEQTGKCTDLQSCTCLFNGMIVEPGAVVRKESEECYCINGTIVCHTPTTTTTASTTTMTTTPDAPSTTTHSTPSTTPKTATTTTPSSTMTPTTTTQPTTSPTTNTTPTTTTTTSLTTHTTSTTTTTTTTTPTTTAQPTTSLTTHTTSTTTTPTTIAQPTTSPTVNTTPTTTTTTPTTTAQPTTSLTTHTTATTTTPTTTAQPTTSPTTNTTPTTTTTTPTTTAQPTTSPTINTTPTTTTTTSTPTTTAQPTTSLTTHTTSTTTTTPTTTTAQPTTSPTTNITPTTTTTTTPTTTAQPTTSPTTNTTPTTTTTTTTTPTTTAQPTTSLTTHTTSTTTTITPTTTAQPTTSLTTTTATTLSTTTTSASTITATTTASPTTIISTTTTTAPSTTITSLPSTVQTTTHGSTTTHPPSCECVNLKSKQTWPCGAAWTQDCNHVTCTNGVLQFSPVQCPQYPPPSCPRGLAVNVSDGCCERPTCDCRCDLYGDPHYISFQGVTFDFFDECTYILVEEQSPEYNLRIAVDNFFCVEDLQGSCVKGVIVEYKGNTAKLTIDSFKVQASLNNATLDLPYDDFGMSFMLTGYVTTLVLPEIRSYVSLTPFFSLVVSLAMENFGNNTQGQCGVCGGGSCIRRGGLVEDDGCCEKTAHDWVHKDPQKPKCESAPKDKPCGPPSPRTPCPTPSTPSLCELLNQTLFAQCREHVNLLPIMKSCEIDSCGSVPPCSSLEKAADECKKNGFCVEWREHTNGSCVIPCSEGLVYKECSPKWDDFCIDGRSNKGKAVPETIAGCFCPGNKSRSSSGSNICVDHCKFCIGPLGQVIKPGEVWKSNCHNCTCKPDYNSPRENTELSEQSVHVECSLIIPPPPPKCAPTQVLVNRCCGLYDCVEKTCTYKGKTYTVGETWRDGEEPCMSFICSIEGIQNETKVCPAPHCSEEDKIWDDQHCCFSCRDGSSCAPVRTTLNVSVEQCFFQLQVPVCKGFCQSHHRMVMAGKLQVEQRSHCCAESRFETRAVTVQCSDQSNHTFEYSHITHCECNDCPLSIFF